ncbi:MAG TPA: potassium-transporting ATPase subunit KdpB [Thermomicrobiaceae bacterium]|nr:potassium-transporting ATPase subunit KdpB [Thermomicrobiaceae bacterium]
MSQSQIPDRPPVHTHPERDADPTRGLEPPTERSPETDAMKALSARRRAGASVWTWQFIRPALGGAVRKLDPRWMVKSPVMFVVEIGSVVTTVVMLKDVIAGPRAGLGFVIQISLWLWFTVLFANFAEALAEARGKAQADTLRATRKDTPARRVVDGREETISSADLRKGDLVLVHEGELIPSDGDVVAGVAYVNEAAITGESAPVLKEPGTDIRSTVTGGTQVTSDWLRIRITADPGHTFLDRMIALVEGASRQKTPNEIALSILLAGLSIIFVLVVVTLEPFSIYAGASVSTTVLVALLVCLLPTTIGALLSAIGIAGMDRVTRFNVLAMSGRAVEAAGDVDVLLLDKTGTITYGNRLAAEVMPVEGASQEEALHAALWSSLGDDTPEGKSIVSLTRKLGQSVPAEWGDGTGAAAPSGVEVIPFRAETRMSGLRLDGSLWQKGAVDAVYQTLGREPSTETRLLADRIAGEGGTPLAVADGARPVGLIYLKDTVKPGMAARFDELRRMGIRTIMVTGDNPLTARTIATEAGVDDFIAQAKPEDKIARIRAEQEAGHLVAMSGDGTNDAPALAQSDVGLAMNSGTAAAKDAANMVDLDSDPTKLIEVVQIGKQLLITRGAITTFSVANDVAKYFAIIPAAFAVTYPELNALNIMRLGSPQSAILSAVIFNALVIIALIPLAMRGVAYRAVPAAEMLRRNILIYGLGGVIVPFIGIKLIDLLVRAIGLA